MGSASVQVFAVVVASAFMAGCVAGSAEDASLDPNLGDAGVVVGGLIISEELFPVVGANVTLKDFATTLTDDRGRFQFDDVATGVTYNLSVQAEGYHPFAMDLEVLGPIDDVRVPMVGIPGKSPYVTTIIHDGFNVCSFSAVYSAGPLPSGVCPFGTPKGGPKVEVGPEWQAGVHELSWRTQEDMIFASSVATEDTSHGRQRASCITSGARSDWCPAMVWGGSPLRIVARPNDTEYAKRYAINGKDTWPGGENYTSWTFASYSGYAQRDINRTFYDQCVVVNRQFNIPEKWGCPFGVGYSLGVKLTFYHTTFYLQAPSGRLEEFTAMPDN